MPASSAPGAVPLTVRQLGPDEAAAATAALADAFAGYPVMRFVLGDGPDFHQRLATLAGFFVTARLLRGEPILGAFAGDELRGVALVSLPGAAPEPHGLDAARTATWAALGPAARERYVTFSRACQALTVLAPHLHLNMLGVPARHRGSGAARALLDAVHAMSRAHPGSTGVTLTTEDPRNVALYEHVGYRVIGRATIVPGLESWGMFRPD